jgi:hypothetical protein
MDGEGAQRPILRGNEPKKTRVRAACGQNTRLCNIYIQYVLYTKMEEHLLK